MTRRKRLTTIGLASAAIAVGTLLAASPAQAKDSACAAASQNLGNAMFEGSLYDMFLMRRPASLDMEIMLQGENVRLSC